jgi:hypothetical protein
MVFMQSAEGNTHLTDRQDRGPAVSDVADLPQPFRHRELDLLARSLDLLDLGRSTT